MEILRKRGPAEIRTRRKAEAEVIGSQPCDRLLIAGHEVLAAGNSARRLPDIPRAGGLIRWTSTNPLLTGLARTIAPLRDEDPELSVTLGVPSEAN